MIEEVEKLWLIWINKKLLVGDSVSGGIIWGKTRQLHDDLVRVLILVSSKLAEGCLRNLRKDVAYIGWLGMENLQV